MSVKIGTELRRTIVAYFRKPIRIPAMASLLILALGLLNILSALLPAMADRVEIVQQMLPLQLREGSRTLTVLLGIALVFLSRGLWRGKRQAWLITIVLLAVSVPIHITRALNVEQASLALTLVALLFIYHGEFKARSDPPSVRRGYVMLLATGLVVVVYALVGLYILQGQLSPHTNFGLLVNDMLNWATSDSPIFYPKTERAVWFLNSIPWITGATLMYGMWMVLRPVVDPFVPHEEARRQAHHILGQHGANPLSTFLPDHDKRYFISEDGDGVIGYRVAGRVVVLCGDPVVPPEKMESFLNEFMEYARLQDWQVVMYEVLPENMGLYRRHGFQAFKIGEDAIIDAQAFTLVGKRMANVRHSVTHAQKAGIEPVFFFGRVTDAEINRQLAAISSAWIAQKRMPEMGFTLGRFQENMPEGTCTVVALDAERQVHGFLTFRYLGGRQMWVLDLMRRLPDAPGGTMELLIAGAVERFRDEGAAYVSLSLSPLANTQSSGKVSLLQNPMEKVFRYFSSSLYKYKSLFDFKAKFNPVFENRYLVYQNARSLPQIVYALIRVHLVGQPRDSLYLWRQKTQAQCAEQPEPEAAKHPRLVGPAAR